MSVQIANVFQAYGSVSGAGVRVSGAGFTVRRTLNGVYFIRLDQETSGDECACLATLRGSAGFPIIEQFSDREKIVYTLDETGTAFDAAFDFLVLRTPS